MSKVTDSFEQVFEFLITNSNVQEALKFLKEDNDSTTEDQIAVTTIPAPTFQEGFRGKEFEKRFRELGLENIFVDEVGNMCIHSLFKAYRMNCELFHIIDIFSKIPAIFRV